METVRVLREIFKITTYIFEKFHGSKLEISIRTTNVLQTTMKRENAAGHLGT